MRNRTRAVETCLVIFILKVALLAPPARGDEIKDVTFNAPRFSYSRATTEEFKYNGRAIGAGREGFQAIVDQIARLPAGTSIVWSPDYSRCGACSGSEERGSAPRFLYPDLWKQLEAHVAERGLTLSSLYPHAGESSVQPAGARERKREAESSLTIDWDNYCGPETVHDDVLYIVDGRFVGRGDQGFNQVLNTLARLPVGASVTIPRYVHRGRAAFENLGADGVKRENARLHDVAPFAARRGEFDMKVTERKLRLQFDDKLLRGSDRSPLDWGSGERDGHAFVAFGRIVRHDEKPRAAAARLGWSRFDATERHKRQPETEAYYTIDDIKLGQGVAGFAKAMDKLAALPPGSVVHVPVCVRTKGPFVCALIYKGHRHFERTGFEPYFGMFPWLLDVAEKGRLEIEWIPDERKSCGDCQLNK